MGAKQIQKTEDTKKRKIIEPAAEIHANMVMNNSYKEKSRRRGIQRELADKLGTKRLSDILEIAAAT
jgi:hypothetical protein